MRFVLPLAFACAAVACNETRAPAPGSSNTTPTAETTAPSTPPPSATASAPATSEPTDAAVAATDAAPPPTPTKTDTIETSKGPLGITPIHHASILFEFGGKTIYVDPWTEGQLQGLPKADYIFITDIHYDHLDSKAIDMLKKESTVLVGPPAVAEKQPLTVTLKNGASKDFGAFKVETVPMYNLKRGPEAGKLFHDKGRGNGYVFTFGDKRVYDSGDTECTPEMKALKKIDVAFVCMNLPYTMTPAEAAECVTAFRPKVVFPFHFRGQDPEAFAADVKKDSAGKSPIDVRVRTWY